MQSWWGVELNGFLCWIVLPIKISGMAVFRHVWHQIIPKRIMDGWKGITQTIGHSNKENLLPLDSICDANFSLDLPINKRWWHNTNMILVHLPLSISLFFFVSISCCFKRLFICELATRNLYSIIIKNKANVERDETGRDEKSVWELRKRILIISQLATVMNEIHRAKFFCRQINT